MSFEGIRQSFDELLKRATKPEERRVVAARMKETLVQARVGLEDLRGGLDKARKRLVVEEKELETVRRRRQLAEGIKDQQTVDIAAKYEEMHQQRVDILKQKVSVQEAELALAERDVESMTKELKAVVGGASPSSPAGATIDSGEPLDPLSQEEAEKAGVSEEINSLRRARESADREADAARRLDELKRRMGK